MRRRRVHHWSNVSPSVIRFFGLHQAEVNETDDDNPAAENTDEQLEHEENTSLSPQTMVLFGLTAALLLFFLIKSRMT